MKKLFRHRSSETGGPSTNSTTVTQPVIGHDEKTGLFELSPPRDVDKVDLDIIAVHGLMGHPYKTWQDGNNKSWLEEYLPAKLPNARIFSYGYNSEITFTSSVATINGFARTLLARTKLARTAEEEHGRPILFICHSLGGIVVKKALITAFNYGDRYEDILNSVKGIAFLGVPHQGSSIAKMGKYFADLLKATYGNTNADLLGDLSTGSRVLMDISADAVHRICTLQICTFYETRMYRGELIVDEQSATLNLPDETVIPVDADHRTICKFGSKGDQCDLIGGTIVELAKDIIQSQQTLSLKASKGPEPPIYAPPALKIHAAYWGTKDVKATLMARIQPNQKLEVDTRYDLDTPDPWFNVRKSTSIMYSFGNGSLQLMVTYDAAGCFMIDPAGPERSSHLNPDVRESQSKDIPGKVEILAVVWGGMLNHSEPFSVHVMDKIQTMRKVECTNEFFDGYDGMPTWPKTCHVFWRMKGGQDILCQAGKEGETIFLPDYHM